MDGQKGRNADRRADIRTEGRTDGQEGRTGGERTDGQPDGGTDRQTGGAEADKRPPGWTDGRGDPRAMGAQRKGAQPRGADPPRARGRTDGHTATSHTAHTHTRTRTRRTHAHVGNARAKSARAAPAALGANSPSAHRSPRTAPPRPRGGPIGRCGARCHLGGDAPPTPPPHLVVADGTERGSAPLKKRAAALRTGWGPPRCHPKMTLPYRSPPPRVAVGTHLRRPPPHRGDPRR